MNYSFLIKTLVQSNLILVLSALLFIGGRKIFKGNHISLVHWAQGILLLSILSPALMQMMPQEKMPTVKFIMPLFNEGGIRSKKPEINTNFTENKTAPAKTNKKHSLPPIHAETLVFWTFISGLVLMLFRFLKNYLSLRHTLRTAIPLKKMGKVTVAVSDEVSVPLSAKIMSRNWVLLPLEILRNKRDLRIAVTHELQHHRQHDTLWAMLMEGLVCFFYFNPAMYLWKKEIIELQEYSCDAALIGHKNLTSHEYGSCLVRVAETALRTRQMYSGTMCMAVGSQNPIYFKSFLRRRIEMLTQKTKSKYKWTVNIFGTLVILLTMSFAFGANQKLNAIDRINPGKVGVDENIQRIAQRILKEEVEAQQASAGFALVADPHTGKILAIANTSKDKSAEQWALSERFEPASVVKTLVIAETIENGLTTPEEKHSCENGNYKYNGTTYHDWKDEGWSELTTEETLTNSSNICAIKIGEKLGNEKIVKMLGKFGIGPQGVTKNLPGARSGLIPELENTTQLIPAVTSGFGMKMTPIEILQAYGAIANGGNLMTPKSFDSKDTQGQVIRRVLSEDTATKMRQMLRQVVIKGTGKKGAQSSLYSTAGKTGTGYIPDLTEYYLVKHSTNQSNLAEFVGFAPAEDPKVEVFVAIFEPKTDKGRAHGSTNAGPVFRKTVDQILQYMKIPPDLK